MDRVLAAVRCIISAAPDLGLGVAFVAMWVRPSTFGSSVLAYLTLTMLLEFIVIHSAALMGAIAFTDTSQANRTIGIVGLALVYSLFVAAFAGAFKTWWPLWAFWSLSANRLSGVILGTASGENKAAVAAGWAISVTLYVGGAFATVLLPIPHLGMTADVVQSIAAPGGVWVEQPHRLLAFGGFYFLFQGLIELLRA